MKVVYVSYSQFGLARNRVSSTLGDDYLLLYIARCPSRTSSNLNIGRRFHVEFTLRLEGQRPEVHDEPYNLDWGQSKLSLSDRKPDIGGYLP